MIKKVEFPINSECQKNELRHKNRLIINSYNCNLLLLYISSDTSVSFPASLPLTNFDSGTKESELSKLLGDDDCRACYFRVSSGCFPASITQANLKSILGEPDLSKMLGYEDCETCYFRMSTIERITQNVKKLRGG